MRYRPDLTSVNTISIFTSAANCGGPTTTPGRLSVTPSFQTVPPNVTALLSATGGDGSYAWEVGDGSLSGSGGAIGVVFTNDSESPVTKTITVSSGGSSVTAEIQVEGIRTLSDTITVTDTTAGAPYVSINGGAAVTGDPYTTLTLAHGFSRISDELMTMKLGLTAEALDTAAEQPFDSSVPWNICGAFQSCDDGMYAVYAVYRTSTGVRSPIVSDTILLSRDTGLGGGAAVTIDDGASVSLDRIVNLTLDHGFAGTPAHEVTVQLSNEADAVLSAPAVQFSDVVSDWDLCAGLGTVCQNDLKTVYARYCHLDTCRSVVYDDILLDSPWPDWGVRINDNAASTATNDVQLRLNPWFNTTGTIVFISNLPDFTSASSMSYGDVVPWDLCRGLFTCDSADHTVFVRYVNGGNPQWPDPQSPRYEDDIALGATPTPTVLPAGILIQDGADAVTSRYVRVTFTSPFGTGPNVKMRPANENGLTARDRDIIATLGGGIDSQPRSATPETPKGPPLTPLPALRLQSPVPTASPAPPTDGQLNRTLEADAIGLDVPELDSGIIWNYRNQLTGWDLCTGAPTCPYGTYKIFVQYYRTPTTALMTGVLGALGDEVSSVYYDTVVYTDATPTPPVPPTPTPPGTPVPTGIGAPPAGTPPTGVTGVVGGVIDVLGTAQDTIGLVALVSSVAVLMSAFVTLTPLLSSAGAGAFAFAGQWFMGVIGLLPKRKNVWGTVYDANTKRPIPFAKVQLLDRNRRVLETRIADKDGRYGFLTTPESLMAQNVQIQILPVAHGYTFPSHTAPTVDTLIYNNLYFGDLITVNDKTLINFDVPMDSLKPSSAPLVLKSPSIALGASVAAIADAGFWLGVVMVPVNFIIAPNPFTFGVLCLFFGTASLRIWGISEHPFGIIKDKETGRPMSFALITLNDLTGKRVTFTVTDEQGRYFLVVEKGTYTLNVFTPASIQPGRQSSSTIEARKGWITRELTL